MQQKSKMNIIAMGNFNNELKAFSPIPQALIYDTRLSDRARFVYVYMASKPEGWDFFLMPFAKEIGYSVDTLRKYINELVSSGWLIKGEQKTENGKFGAVEYTLKATLDFPTRKNSDTVNYRHGNLPTLNNIDNIHNIDDKDNIDNEKENSNKKKTCDDEDVNEFVEHIYSLYPTRCPKRNTPTGKCSKDKERIKKLLKTYSKEDIEKVVRYEIQEKYGKHYMANFATFLNNFPDPTTIPDVNSNTDMLMSKPKRKVLVINGVEYR